MSLPHLVCPNNLFLEEDAIRMRGVLVVLLYVCTTWLHDLLLLPSNV